MLGISRLLGRLEASSPIVSTEIERKWPGAASAKGSGAISLPTLQLHHLLNLVTRTAPPGIGFELGRHCRLEEFGPYSHVLGSCGNLTEVRSVIKRYQSSIRQPHFFSDTVVDRKWMIEFAPSGPFASDAVAVIVEDLLTRTRQELGRYTGRNVKFDRVELAYNPPIHQHLYHEQLGCPVFFGRPRTVVTLSADYLYQPLDKAAGNDRSAMEAVKEVFGRINLSERVMLAILETLVFHPGVYPCMQRVADMFGMSVSSLRRLLVREDLNYQSLVDAVRLEHVAEYLAFTSLPPKEIAYRVGFSNVHNFRRAFRRWLSMTPAQYRASVQPVSPLIH